MRRTEYLILFGLDETATADEIRCAYLRRAKPLHPDVNATPEAHEAFRTLTEAYQALRQTTPRRPRVPAVRPVGEASPPPSSPRAPRAARARWAGATAFSISIVGALIAFNAGFWPDDPAPRDSGAKAPSAAPPRAEVSNAMPSSAMPSNAISPKPDTSGPIPTVAPAAPSVPTILLGRSTRHEAGTATLPEPLIEDDPSPDARTPPSPRVALVKPTQDARTRPAQAVPAVPMPAVPKPVVPGQTQPIVSRPTMPTPANPVRAAPVVKRVVPFARPPVANLRPRERDYQGRNGRVRGATGAAPVEPQGTPASPRLPTIESLAGTNLNHLLRSVLQ